mgnify:FL=1
MEVQFFYGKVKKIFSFFALYDSFSGKCPAGKSRNGDNRTLGNPAGSLHRAGYL